MQAIDWNALVPVGGADLASSIASFMTLSIVAGLLIFQVALRLGSALVRTLENLFVGKPSQAGLYTNTADPGYNDGDDIEGTGDQYGGTAYISNAAGNWTDEWQGNRGSYLGRFSQDGEIIAEYGTVSQEDLDDMSDAEIVELYGTVDHSDMVDRDDARWGIEAEYHRRNLSAA